VKTTTIIALPRPLYYNSLINFSKVFSIVAGFNVYVALWPVISLNKRKLRVLIYAE
jgi:hypothetical protein